MRAEDRAAQELIAAPDPERARSLGDEWLDCMRAGDFAGAWRVSDEVMRLRGGMRCDELPRHFQWVWNGKPLDGKRVLIRCYHGLGDTMQYIRYARIVREIAREVIVWVQPELIPLLRAVRGVDRWLPLHESEPEADYDIDVELMELPHVFRSTIATLPNAVPYIAVEPQTLPRDGNLQVGLVWRSGDWDDRRSVPWPLIESLGAIRGVTFHILQRGSGLHEVRQNFGVASGSDDILEAARVIAALDLVISVDSMPAHLAGAVAVPTWTLLRAEADWRWMEARDESPWYPTMRLFRQEREGDWAPVVRRVAAELEKLAG